MIYVGIDDTDILGTPGTNQLARALVKRLGGAGHGAIICRHQLFFDPRVPYTSKNGSASIQLPGLDTMSRRGLTGVLRGVMHEWFVEGSDPGLCVAEEVPDCVTAFGLRCKSEVVTKAEARDVAAQAGIYLEGLGGTEQGVIGALAAIGLAAAGQDGRVVHLASWPYPDEFSGVHELAEIRERGIAAILRIEDGHPVTTGLIDVGKHLRPSWRDRRIVLYVTPSVTLGSAASWSAVKLP